MEDLRDQHNGRYAETARLMDEALLTLLSEGGIDAVTVKAVCARAGVSRSTFYLHYETLADLLQESLRLVIDRFRKHFERRRGTAEIDRLRSCPMSELYLVTSAYVLPYLEFIRDNRSLFEALLRQAGTFRLDETRVALERHVIDPILDRFGVSPATRPYLLAFYLSGLMAIVEEWMRAGCTDAPERVAAVMAQCCTSSRAVERGQAGA